MTILAYFVGFGAATVGDAVMTPTGVIVKAALTDGEILSALANNWLTCHNCSPSTGL